MQKRASQAGRMVYSAITALFALAALILGSLAWYGNIRSTELQPIDGSVVYKARYFESGNGMIATQMVSGYDGSGNPVFINGYNAAQHADITTDAAFEIKTPDQLYNLAWLQFMGYFNAPDADAGNVIPPTYFYLSADLDMTGYILPPIGTSKYPFICNFDGNGHTISNLTITNSARGANALNEIPRLVTEEIGQGDVSSAEIVGLFGVVGKMASDTAADGTITVNGTAYSYSSSATNVQDLTISNITIRTQTPRALAGLAVGYVNGPVSGVAVAGGQLVDSIGAAALDSGNLTSNLSDYSLVGYAEEAYRATTDICSVTHTVKVDTCTFEKINTGDAWGGSIDMRSLFNRLDNVYTTMTAAANGAYYYTRALKTVDVDGNETITYDATSKVRSTPTFSDQNNWNGYYNYDWDGYSIYSFPAYNTFNSTTYSYNMVYGADNTAAGVANALNLTTDTTTNETAYYLSNNGAYLNVGTLNGGEYTLTGGASAVTPWVLKDNKVMTVVDGVQYYLNSDGDSVYASSTESVDWTINTSGSGYLIYNNGLCLYYDTASSQWSLAEITTSFYIKDTVTGYYMNRDGSDLAADASGTTRWTYDSSGRIYTTSGNTTYYLRNNRGTLSLNTNVGNASVWSYDGTYFTSISNRVTYYLRLQVTTTGWWIQTTTRTWTLTTSQTADYTQMTIENEQVTGNTTPYVLARTNSGSTLQVTTQTLTQEDSAYLTNDSVFPIAVTNGDTNGPVYTTDTQRNTGYFVGGAENDGEHIGNFRVAQYPMANLSNAFNQNTYSDTRMEVLTRTAQSGGFVRITDSHNQNNTNTNMSAQMRNFTRWNYSATETTAANTLYLAKYTDSRNAVQTVFNSDSSHVFGIHFMNAAISKDNLAVIPTAWINGDEKTNFEVPRNSIDFTLKDSGFINFFAHTGYVNTKEESSGSWWGGTTTVTDWTKTNNTFFSLHQIYRDAQEHITEIKEIRHVYKAPAGSDIAYVYQYTDGTWSNLTRSLDANYNVIYTYGAPTSSAPAHGAEVFDTNWITKPGMTDNMLKTIFYFEVPANPGEYALGSVGGNVSAGVGTYAANGAYLFYLDISANAQYIERTTTIETITTVTDTYEYPAGVDFATAAASVLDATATVTRPANDSGTATYTVGADSVTVTGKSGLGSTYVEPGLTVTDGGGEITPTPKSTVTTVKVIKTVSDYNTSTYYTMTEISTGDSEQNLSVVSVTSDDPSETNPVMQAPNTTSDNQTPVAAGTPVVSYRYILPEDAVVTTNAVYTHRSFANYQATRQETVVSTDVITLEIAGGSTTVYDFDVKTTPVDHTGKVTVNTVVVDANSEIDLEPTRLNASLARRLSASGKAPLRLGETTGRITAVLPAQGDVKVAYRTGYSASGIPRRTILEVENLVIPEVQQIKLHWIPRVYADPQLLLPETGELTRYLALYRTALAEDETLEIPMVLADTQIDAAFYDAPIPLRHSAAAEGFVWGSETPEGLVALVIPANANGMIRLQTAGTAQPVFVRADGTLCVPEYSEDGEIAINENLFLSAAWHALDADGALCADVSDAEADSYVLLLASDAESSDTVLTELQLRYSATDAIQVLCSAAPAAQCSYVAAANGEKLLATHAEGVYVIAPVPEEKPAEETPALPDTPTDPTDPTEPTEPTEPTDPTDPTGPADPTDPTDPTDPVVPSDPAEPVDPSDPTDPVIPDAPNSDGEGDADPDGQPEADAGEADGSENAGPENTD